MELSDWSINADENGFAVPDGFPDDMSFRGVNNSMREIMAVMSRHFADNNGTLVSFGDIDNFYTLDTNGDYSAPLAPGTSFAFKAHAASSSNICRLALDVGGSQIDYGLILRNASAISAGEYYTVFFLSLIHI